MFYGSYFWQASDLKSLEYFYILALDEQNFYSLPSENPKKEYIVVNLENKFIKNKYEV